MLATKQISKKIPPVSVRLEQEEYEGLGKLTERYPLYSRNKMVRAAVRQWINAASQYGVDANLQPLEKGEVRTLTGQVTPSGTKRPASSH